MFLGFVYAVRLEALTPRLQALAPGAWGRQLLSAPTFQERGRQHLPRLDVGALRERLRSRETVGEGVRFGVVFAIDMRKDDVATLAQDLVYTLPRVEIVALSSKRLEAELPELLAYYELVTSTKPGTLREALDMFHCRHPEVVVLERAFQSASEASDFRAPRLALWSLHFLRRVYVDWADARRRDRHRANHADLQDLRHPARTAMSDLLQNAQFDLSDDTSNASRDWMCADGEKRYFGWHLKWSLAGPRGTANHCRIHYAHIKGDATVATTLYIGHCGEHL